MIDRCDEQMERAKAAEARVATLERERDEARAEIECKRAIDVKTWDLVRDLRIRVARLEAALTAAFTCSSCNARIILASSVEVAVSSSDTPTPTNVAP